MTIAVSEILKQAERLSVEEQLELAAKLTEQAQRRAQLSPRNGEVTGAERPSQPGLEEGVSEEEEEDDWLDTLDLKLMPLEPTYTARVRFHYIGRLEPLPFDFDDFFDDEEEGEDK
ncbi:MAG: hypothetical protein MOB07_26585 [Acidobacteria bacterium]|nr:hypothetical protein [Acidobacteriota bacterium]